MTEFAALVSSLPLDEHDRARLDGLGGANGLITAVDVVDNAACFYLSWSDRMTLALDGIFSIKKCANGGWILAAPGEDTVWYWVPLVPVARQFSKGGHLLREDGLELKDLTISAAGLRVEFPCPPDRRSGQLACWRFVGKGLLGELSEQTICEQHGYFLLGSHTRFTRLADVYEHLKDGFVYENRWSWPVRRRVFSENDAHGLHSILGGLRQVTGKRIYQLLQHQIVMAVVARQSDDGGYRHGEWTDGMESHFRLHCSAMHLLMDWLSENDDPSMRAALHRAASFIADKYDLTDLGVWFYHDELETTEEGMRKAPFGWLSSRLLGKAPQNMLVLNSHLDTLVALDRYARVTGDRQYAELVESGFDAAQRVLALKSADWLYRIVFSAIDLTFLPKRQAARLPVWQRAWKRLGWKYFIPVLPWLKTRFPRLVMPGGYVDRELSLKTWAFDYLAVNLMDLVRVARGHRRDDFKSYVDGIIQHCRRTGVLRRWLEVKRSVYSIGFFAEALILLNLDEPRPDADDLLGEALLLCVIEKIGLPPSVNGRNAEFGLSSQVVPVSKASSVLVANLCTPSLAVCLVVNAGEEPVHFSDVLRNVPAGWVLPNEPLSPHSWLRLQA